MSDIQKALATATECEPSKRKDETITSPDYMKRLCAAVAELKDDEWAKLPVAAQDWYNSAADALEARKDIPEYPDLAKPEAAPAGRRRGAAAEPEKAKEKEKEPAKGDEVEVVTKRGREYVGKIVELDDKGMVLDVDGKDVELDHDKIDKIKVVGGAPAKAKAAEPEEPAEPEVGDTVEVVTARDKIIVGNVEELTDSEVVLKDSTGEIHELGIDRLKSFKVKVKNAGAGKAEPAAAPAAAGRRGAAKAEGAEVKNTKVKASDNGGVSVTGRMRELICDNLEMSKDDLLKVLKKEGLEFKEATLNLIYADSHKLIGMLRDRKRIK